MEDNIWAHKYPLAVEKAELVAVTKPVSKKLLDVDMKQAEDLIAYCARVSNPAGQLNKETNQRLLRYLVKHRHWSPFEMVDAVLEIETTRDIARQILRHRSGSFQEFSQRYADPTAIKNTFVLREARLQDTQNRQNSIQTDDAELKKEWYRKQQDVIDAASAAYKWAIENGIAKEQARAVLPEGNTKSVLFMKASLRTWIHYVDLRSGNGTQLEHMRVAHAVAEAISEVFPSIQHYNHQK